ncbi:MAG: ubiE 2 [Bryobacterales bacterium]|nr:ubiE 2 [Bryobacterales bacterium]
MKHRLMDLLACPECGRFPLELTVLESEPAAGGGARGCAVYCSANSEPVLRDGAPAPCSGCYSTEITEALLHCGGCGQEYPVIEGIPRFNPDVRSDYPEFFQKHADQFRNAKTADLNSFHALHTDTKRSFGYQWLRYRVTDAVENRRTFHRRTATQPGTLTGQLFFEAGCGMGRYLKVIGEEPGAEVVGLDLSLAVNRARAENLDNPRVHVIQGNLMQLPLRRDTFDHVYSIGVLHHTPSTEQAFHSVAKLVKPGGRISVWVYDLWGPKTQRGFKKVHARIRGWISDTLRRITTRLPHSLLHYLCYIAVPLGWLQLRIREVPAPLRFLLSPLLFLPVSGHPEWRVRLCDTFDWYSPKFQWKHTVEEVSEWFENAGLVDLSTEGFPVSVRGRRPAEQRRARREEIVSHKVTTSG